MYTSYSTLQRKQLSKQVYTDTQSTDFSECFGCGGAAVIG